MTIPPFIILLAKIAFFFGLLLLIADLVKKFLKGKKEPSTDTKNIEVPEKDMLDDDLSIELQEKDTLVNDIDLDLTTEVQKQDTFADDSLMDMEKNSISLNKEQLELSTGFNHEYKLPPVSINSANFESSDEEKLHPSDDMIVLEDHVDFDVDVDLNSDVNTSVSDYAPKIHYAVGGRSPSTNTELNQNEVVINHTVIHNELTNGNTVENNHNNNAIIEKPVIEKPAIVVDELLKAELNKYDDVSPILDSHLQISDEQNQNSPLTNAKDNFNISILPIDESSYISGAKLLELIDNFGFKFGTMNMFHRYQNKNGSGLLWFSMMGLTKDGIVPFDLNTLPTTMELKGLVLFLPLPHPKVLQGFDSMMSIAGLISREVNGFIVDDEGNEMTVEYKKKTRAVLQNTLGEK